MIRKILNEGSYVLGGGLCKLYIAGMMPSLYIDDFKIC